MRVRGVVALAAVGLSLVGGSGVPAAAAGEGAGSRGFARSGASATFAAGSHAAHGQARTAGSHAAHSEVRTDGPHSPVGRKPARPTAVRTGGVVVREVDLGDMNIGRGGHRSAFRAPVRGVLVTPVAAKKAPLVVFSHLRSPGCSDQTFAFPCPRGTTEVRYDRGMTYLGQALAAKGYAVLIPDVAPVWSGQYVQGDYDQQAAWLKTVGRLRDEVMNANAGRRTAFGRGLAGAVDGSRTSLFLHSRSGYVGGYVARAWRHSSTPIVSMFAYGGAYTAPGEREPATAPVPGEIPFLGMDGEADNDVHLLGRTWLTEHVGQARTAPALSAVVPGLGHNYVNRALSSRRWDDRPSAAGQPGAAAHERALIAASVQWLDATVKHGRTDLPLTATAALPARLAGLPARWLAVTNAKTSGFLPDVRGTVRPLGRGGAVTVCRPPAEMDPGTRGAGSCPDPDLGVVLGSSRVARITLTPAAGARVTVPATRAREVVLQVAPAGSRTDKAVGTPVRVTLHLNDGRTHVLDVPATHPALRDRATADDNGTSMISTVRLPLPAEVARGTVTSVDLTGGTASGVIELRALDLVR